MKNKMSDLRNHLFETLEALKDEDKPMDIERAKAISDVAQVLINTAKVEIQFMEAVGAEQGADFFEQRPDSTPRLLAPASAIRKAS